MMIERERRRRYNRGKYTGVVNQKNRGKITGVVNWLYS